MRINCTARLSLTLQNLNALVKTILMEAKGGEIELALHSVFHRLVVPTETRQVQSSEL